MAGSYSAQSSPTDLRGRNAPGHPRRVATETSLDTNYVGEIIPPHTTARSLVLCFDGTGDQFDSDNSNIVQLFAMLKKGNKDQQLVYYQAGIGTYTIPQIATPLYSKLSKTVDEMFANNLNHHVMGGYEFLMENYKEGDKICIFGFSRGAYTARALAGMVHKVGLLPNSNHQQVPFAYRMYQKDDEKGPGWKQSVLFKKTFSIDVNIEFVGVWETVASVGIFPRRLPFTKSNTCINTFRHALSLDEHRAKFKQNNYQFPTKEEAVLDQVIVERQKKIKHKHLRHNSKAVLEDIADAARHGAEVIKRVGSRSNSRKDDTDEGQEMRLEEMYTNYDKPTDALEVWFAGCHCDIGGGSVPNDTRHSLARITLRWMIRECFLTNTGIQFEADKLRDIAGIDPANLYPIVKPRPPPLPVPVPAPITPMNPAKAAKASMKAEKAKKRTVLAETENLQSSPMDASFGDKSEAPERTEEDRSVNSDDDGGAFLGEEEEELRDALCPIYDQLKLAPPWWLLEILPMSEREQKDDGTWTKRIGLNRGRPRVFPQQAKNGIKVHRSVKMRMEAQGLDYKPRLRFEVDPEWVD
ncbi:hypothetical protein M0805_000211 [Coniferiporia weirii]|nr:hypothetical protein M0805_000211 [Coniferiporia weirii]